MTGRYPPIEPYDHGMLDVGGGDRVYWEVCGNPAGRPAVVVHGGPGSACTPGHRRSFDPERYRVVLFDQRGCGRSTPAAGDPGTDMARNTTDHLVADMEALREHLGIDRWLLSGASWGSTLLLAYAERFPHRVSHIVISAVAFTTRAEVAWLYHGLRCFFPAEWDRFRAGAEPATGPDGDLLAAYARLLADPDPVVRERAAVDWHTWEDATVSLEPSGTAGAYSDRPLSAMLSRARICAHYFSHAAWLEEGVLLREAHRLAGIPGALIHGRFDLGSPLANAWDLARAWPDARLHVIDDSGHTGSATMSDVKRQVLDAFAAD
jgi:proline iminopeptidase